MKVLFAGASGTLGLALVPQLLAAGHEVVSLSRSGQGPSGTQVVTADVLDRDALLGALDGLQADAVLHELTALRSAPTHYRSMRATNTLRITGTANLVEAAQLLGASRIVTQSIVFGYGYRTARPTPVTESAPFAVPENAPVDAVHEALASTESQVRGAGGIALRYGLFYGLDAPSVKAMLSRRMLPVTAFDGVIPMIHHEDAAAATVAALERGVAGSAYNIADDTPVSWRRHIETAATALGSPRPLRVPQGLLRVVTPYAAELMTRLDLRVSTELAHRELGWTPRYPSVAEGWAAVSEAPA